MDARIAATTVGAACANACLSAWLLAPSIALAQPAPLDEQRGSRPEDEATDGTPATTPATARRQPEPGPAAPDGGPPLTPATAPASSSPALDLSAPQPAGKRSALRPTAVAVVVAGQDLQALRPAAVEIHAVLAGDRRFRPEFRPEMRAALEEPRPPDPHVFLAGEALDRARAALGQLAFDEAAREARAATSELLLARHDDQVTTMLADAAVIEGVALHLRGDGDAADRAFRFARVLDPGRELDPVTYRADIRERWRKAAGSSGPRGRLLSRSSPAGCTVVIDGRVAGTTPRDGKPLVTELTTGVHLVTVTRAGYFPRVQQVAVSAATPAEVNPYLSRSEKPDHVRDLVAGLRAAMAAGDADREGRTRLELASILEVDALIVLTDADGRPPDESRTAAISVYDGKDASRVGERVLELGRRAPTELGDDLYVVMPVREPKDVVKQPPRPPPPKSAPPLWRRWWFIAGVAGVLVAGTITSAVMLSEDTYRGVIEAPE